MTRDKRKFLSLEKRNDGGYVAFGDNRKVFIKGVDKIGKPNSAQIENVYYVKEIKHNLLSIIQLYDNGYNVKFEPNALPLDTTFSSQY